MTPFWDTQKAGFPGGIFLRAGANFFPGEVLERLWESAPLIHGGFPPMGVPTGGTKGSWAKFFREKPFPPKGFKALIWPGHKNFLPGVDTKGSPRRGFPPLGNGVYKP